MRTIERRYAVLAMLWPIACSIHERDLGDPSANESANDSSNAGAGGARSGGGTRSVVGAGGATKNLDASESSSPGGVPVANQGGEGEPRGTDRASCGAQCAGAFAAGASAVEVATSTSGSSGVTTTSASGSGGLGNAGGTLNSSSSSGMAGLGNAGGATFGTANGGTANGGTANGGTATASSTSSFSGCTIAQQRYPKAHVNVDNSCEICDPNRSTMQWTPLEEGALCGEGQICHERVCQAGCWIQGAYHSTGATRSAIEPCKSCQPQLNVSDWSNTPAGTRCGSGGGQFCSTGACRSGCWIDSAYRAVGEVDPNSGCRSCNPSNDTAWTRGPSCVTSMVSGNDHNCALLDAATLKCWGNNASGQLGNDSLTPSSIPVAPAVPSSGSLGRIKAVATGHEHTCVVLENGRAWCWGNNNKGQLGNPSAAAQESRPVRAATFENAQAVAAGFEHTCVVLLGGSVQCWGSNAFGQIGKSPASNEPVLTPHQVPSISTARSVVAGANHTCAILQDNTVRCWGNGTKGQLGDGFSVDRPSPVNPSLANVSTLGAGSTHTCVVLTSGGLQCWGYNGFGQLGIDGERPFEDKVTATPVQQLSAFAAHVATGVGHTCVALVGGAGQCFGRDSYWQLGDNAEFSDKGEPVTVLSLSHAVQVAAGRDHSCATLANGAARCWGRNLYGQLGNNSTDDSFEPVNVVGL